LTSTSLTTDCRLLCAATCAYDILDSGSFTAHVSPHYPAVGWTSVPTAFFAGLKNINACLIGTNQEGSVILAFRGTLPPTNLDVVPQLRDWMQNFMAEPVAKPGILPPGMTVHEGFWDAVDSLWPQIVPALKELLAQDPQAKLYVTGHSKGGAMAALAAARLFFQENIHPTAVYLYAPARAGNSTFVSGFPPTVPVVRYEHHLDIVPFVPPGLQFIELAARVAPLSDLFADAKEWDYTPLGTLHYIKADGTVVGDDPILSGIRVEEILARVVTGHPVDIGRAHAPWCQGLLSDGGYMLGVCPTSLCATED
jgi:hypothetical protein